MHSRNTPVINDAAFITDTAFNNDNVGTEHLKCPDCRTRVFLIKIEPDQRGGEIRTFGCPHCRRHRLLHLTAADDRPA